MVYELIRVSTPNNRALATFARFPRICPCQRADRYCFSFRHRGIPIEISTRVRIVVSLSRVYCNMGAESILFVYFRITNFYWCSFAAMPLSNFLWFLAPRALCIYVTQTVLTGLFFCILFTLLNTWFASSFDCDCFYFDSNILVACCGVLGLVVKHDCNKNRHD